MPRPHAPKDHHGVGRFYVDATGRNAEAAAFVVREWLRRRGLGTRLLKTLVDVARRRGLEAMWGHCDATTCRCWR